MAEQNKATSTSDVKEEETHSANMDPVSACDHYKQKDTDELNQKISSSAPLIRGNGENVEQAGVQKETSGWGEDNKLNMEKNSSPLDDGSCGDFNSGTPKDEEPTKKPGDNDAGTEKEPEALTTPTLSDTKDDQDGCKDRLDEEPTAINVTSTVPPEDWSGGQEKALAHGAGKDLQENTTFQHTPLPEEISEEKKLAEQREKNVETIGPTTQGTTKHSVPKVTHIHGGDNDAGNGKVLEEPATSTLGDKKDDQDGSKDRLDKGPICVNNTNPETREDDGEGTVKALAPEAEKNVQENTTSAEEREKNVKTIGPTTQKTNEHSVTEDTVICGGDNDAGMDKVPEAPATQETTKHSAPDVPGIWGGSKIYLIAVCIVGLLAVLVPLLLQPESPPQKNLQQIDIFRRQMEKVESQFPKQRPELWKRSRIHLERHLNTTHPTEPVSLILTAGLSAERTLRCLAQGLASTFSSALNASILHIDGASKASQDSDQVKLDIDSQLQGAFEGVKPVAVIHRFEELPPGSTLIFYRYCDHENAAYKKTFLIFTVLLGEEEEIPAKIRLSAVEEMVDDHLQKKFLSHSHPVAFDRMDLDKYGGLWSRISHLILPVAAEKEIEHGGCKWT